MKVIYIAGKYTDAHAYLVKQNIQRAEALGMEVARMGASVIVPHTNTAHWEGVQSDQWFYDATLELLKRCDALVYVPGDIERSTGTRNEVQYCKDNRVPFFCGNEAGLDEFHKWLTNEPVIKMENDD